MTDDTPTRHRYARMMTIRGAAVCSAAALALMLPSAHAALGGNGASISNDRAALAPADSAASSTASSLAAVGAANAAAGTASASAYTMQSLVDTGGTTINEYLDSNGAVFAIAWDGPFMPNLSQLLGSYFADYTSAVAANQVNATVRSPAAIDNGELVVKSGGHMGAFRGMAYLKNRLPGGFAVNQIR